MKRWEADGLRALLTWEGELWSHIPERERIAIAIYRPGCAWAASDEIVSRCRRTADNPFGVVVPAP